MYLPSVNVVIVEPMPSGVEHSVEAIAVCYGVAGDRRADALGR